MVTQTNVPRRVVNIKTKLDVNVNIIQSAEIVIRAIQLTMMPHGKQLVFSMHIHAKV